MSYTPIELVATVIFALAVLHTFIVGKFQMIAKKYPSGSIGENFFHFLGEVEVVFGLWSSVFFIIYSITEGFSRYNESHQLVGGALHYLESQNYTEPIFVFVIMCMASTRPIVILAETAIKFIAKAIPLPEKVSFYLTALCLGPLLGSFITEPAAMAVTAIILLDYFYSHKMSSKFMYATLGLLFVNVSIGGTLTHFAAPPVVMVASKWHFDFTHMLNHFGYKASIAIFVSTLMYVFIFKDELKGNLNLKHKEDKKSMQPKWWIYVFHLIFLTLVILNSHHLVFFSAVFLFFMGFMHVTSEYQDNPKLRESLMVGFFLGGLIVLGGMQSWWLKVVITQMSDLSLFIGATALTGITDNAALTYLGSLVELSDSAKYNLLAGAVAGGGLTVIANAPNPVGFGILKNSFGGTVNPLYLFLGALGPTLIACLCFQWMP